MYASASAAAWDNLAPIPPQSLGRPWDQSKTVQDFDGRAPVPVTKVTVRSLKTKVPIELQLNCGEPEQPHGATVADVRAAFSRELMISSRKAITLRWLGADLPDDGTPLTALHVPNGAQLEAAFRQRSLAELEELKNLRQILLVDNAGNAVPCEVTPTTLVSDLKAMWKQPPEAELYFTPHYTSAFGTPLVNDRTLVSVGVLNGDVLFMKTPSTTAEAPKEEPKKKK